MRKENLGSRPLHTSAGQLFGSRSFIKLFNFFLLFENRNTEFKILYKKDVKNIYRGNKQTNKKTKKK